MSRRGAAWALLLVACGKDPGAAPKQATSPTCEELAFAQTLPIAEASGAVVLPDGLLVVSDSGNGGAYVIADATTGDVIGQGQLPLGAGASDDLEGLALARDGTMWGVTSSGWMRAWKRDGAGFALIDGPYPLGKHAACDDGEAVNCGANYEGLCLAPVPPGDDGCVGFVASKADGRLHCVIEEEGRLRAHRKLSIAVSPPETLSDCAFDPAGDAVWTGDNLLGADLVNRVTGWRGLSEAVVTPVGEVGAGFSEVIAVGQEGVIYRLSDMSGSPSLATRWKCSLP